MAESRLLVVTASMGGPRLLATRLGRHSGLQNLVSNLAAAFLQDVTLTAQSLPAQSAIKCLVDTQEPLDEGSGEHLAEIFQSSLAAGTEAVCAIGMLTPHLPAPFILEAFGRLAEHPGSVVVGPTDTGSCYLVGVSNVTLAIALKDIDWGKPNVLKDVVQQALTSELSLSFLPSIVRVETSSHLKELSRDFHRGVAIAPHTQITIRNLELV